MEQKTPEYEEKNRKDSNKGNQNKDVNLVLENKVDYVEGLVQLKLNCKMLKIRLHVL